MNSSKIENRVMDSFKLFNKEFPFFKILITSIFIAGILLRVIFYSFDRAFWNDECALALNIVKTWNYFSTLEYNQVAPPIFLYLSKIFYYIFPDKELALRFLPLLFSIGSIPLFYKLTKTFVKNKFSILVATVLFVFSYNIIYYAQEFKQYSSDIFVFLLILLSYKKYSKPLTKKDICLLSFIYTISVWFSFTSIFALFAILITVILYYRENLKKTLLIFISVGISLLCLYCLTLTTQHNNYLYEFWDDGFISGNLSSIIKLVLKNLKYAFSSIIIPMIFLFTALIVSVFKEKNKPEFCLIISPVILTLFFSYLKIYPFKERLILFLIPVFMIFSAKVFDYIKIKNNVSDVILKLFLCYILVSPLIHLTHHKIFLHNYKNEDMPSLLEIAYNNAKIEDTIIIAESNVISYNYYSRDINSSIPVITEDKRVSNTNEYIKRLSSYPKGRTYYWICSRHKDQKEFLQYVMNWAEQYPDFSIHSDKHLNTIIRYTLK